MRTGLTSAISLSRNQEQQDCSALGCAGCQPVPCSAATGTATGSLRTFVNMKVGAWPGMMCRLGEMWPRDGQLGAGGPVGCGCGGDDV